MGKNKGGNMADMRNADMTANNTADMTNTQNNKANNKKDASNKNKGSGAQNMK